MNNIQRAFRGKAKANDNRRILTLASGGSVRGPGGPTDDMVPAMLSNGEYVLPADTVDAIGAHNLDALKDATHAPSGRPNLRGGTPHLEDGGWFKNAAQRAVNGLREGAGWVGDKIKAAGAPIEGVAGETAAVGKNATTPAIEAITPVSSAESMRAGQRALGTAGRVAGTALGGAGALYHSTQAVKAASDGDWQGAGAHGLRAIGSGVSALPGVGTIAGAAMYDAGDIVSGEKKALDDHGNEIGSDDNTFFQQPETMRNIGVGKNANAGRVGTPVPASMGGDGKTLVGQPAPAVKPAAETPKAAPTATAPAAPAAPQPLTPEQIAAKQEAARREAITLSNVGLGLSRQRQMSATNVPALEQGTELAARMNPGQTYRLSDGIYTFRGKDGVRNIVGSGAPVRGDAGEVIHGDPNSEYNRQQRYNREERMADAVGLRTFGPAWGRVKAALEDTSRPLTRAGAVFIAQMQQIAAQERMNQNTVAASIYGHQLSARNALLQRQFDMFQKNREFGLNAAKFMNEQQVHDDSLKKDAHERINKFIDGIIPSIPDGKGGFTQDANKAAEYKAALPVFVNGLMKEMQAEIERNPGNTAAASALEGLRTRGAAALDDRQLERFRAGMRARDIARTNATSMFWPIGGKFAGAAGPIMSLRPVSDVVGTYWVDDDGNQINDRDLRGGVFGQGGREFDILKKGKK